MINNFIQTYLLKGFDCSSFVAVPGNAAPDVRGLFCAIFNTITILLAFAGTVALLFLIYGGIQYMMSQGDEKLLTTAKNTITFAVIGLFLILGSMIGLNLVFSILGVK